ncbi:MAG: 5-formyltetrahydrofolate cyclo-ligase [Bacteroidia bacterium]|nr:5-formyltetrahydrofolate cyclo-ligase [Bacteroidia bacterium]
MDYTSVKDDIRKQALQIRKEFTDDQVRVKSARMFEFWKMKFPLKGMHFVHLFLSIDKFKEPQTSFFLDHIRSHHPEIRIVVPLTDSKKGVLRHQLLDPGEKVKANSWGIPEPTHDNQIVLPNSIDMVLVPLLAFGSNGHRIGYGKGFYDKFLVNTRPDCLKIGLCFEMGRINAPLPADQHDVALDWVITENEIVKFD